MVPAPRWLYRLVLTPQVHWLHHARPMALSCSNCANVFPWGDVLFGSFEHPDDHPIFEYGIEEPRQPEGFLGQLVAPFEDWRQAASGFSWKAAGTSSGASLTRSSSVSGPSE